MQKKRSLKIISIVLILVLICLLITYSKNDSKVVLATTKKLNSENLQDNEHMHVELDNSGDKVPVPNGYVGSKVTGENEIDTGYVIYEGTEEVNDSNVEEAQKTRNQYVWIPVPDASTMYGIDENGKKWGKLYTFTTDTGDNVDPMTGSKPLNWSESDGVIKILSTLGNREPATLVNNYDINSRIEVNKINSKHGLLIQLEKEFNSIIESVEKYSGFYIGRYETGDLNNENAVVRKGNINISNQNWYMMYKKCKKLNNKNTNIETGMIWGSQWDRTLMWLVESGNKTREQICNDASNWGNYKNSTFKYINTKEIETTKESNSGIKIPTGSTEYTKANNIYDMAGNVLDWTMEANTVMHRIFRGGDYGSISGKVYSRSVFHPIQGLEGLRLPSNAIHQIT